MIKHYLCSAVSFPLTKSNFFKMKKATFFLSALLIGSVFTFSSCSDDDDDVVPQQNIVELAQGNENLSSLVAAVQRAGLVDALSDPNSNLTVFAPTNAAFAAFLTANGFATLEDVPLAVLTQVLLNHVVGSELKAADLSTGYVSTLATFGTTTANLSLFVSTASGVVLNGGPAVTAADVDASNGVVHVIDEVIALPTIVTHALSNPNLSILVQALTRPDLTIDFVSILSGAGPYTAFAPTNDAFVALLGELELASLNDIPVATLEAVLTYHVANGNVRAGSLTEGQVIPTLNTGTFTIGLSGGAKITDANNRVANIVATDVQGANGVVHVIDKVILPS
jgi:uncharacterized surface protein with fasciclin (FAS1) repeats